MCRSRRPEKAIWPKHSLPYHKIFVQNELILASNGKDVETRLSEPLSKAAIGKFVKYCQRDKYRISFHMEAAEL